MTSHLVPRPALPPPPQPPEDKPFYGWRYLRHEQPDGTVELEQVELTLEDVLHPQEDDKIPEGTQQERERSYLTYVCRARQPRLRGGLVLSDCIINWGVPGVLNHSPDVSVFERLRRQPGRNLGTFRLAIWGGRCLLVIEIVSPHTRVNDVLHKLVEYHQAGVPLYILVDQEREGGPRSLLAYRHRPSGYEPAPRDAQGRVELPKLGLLLGLVDDCVVCYDADTEVVIGDYTQVTEDREAARAAQKAAERRERRATRRAQREAEGRAAAEQRLRELEAELRRLRGGTSE